MFVITFIDTTKNCNQNIETMMLTRIIAISLIITAIHVSTWDGMILHRPATRIGEMLDKMRLSVLRKPLFECLICMGGIYTIALDPIVFGELSLHVISDMLCVIGLNTIISAFICRMQE